MSSRTAIFSQSHPRKIKITWGKALSWTAIILTLIIILFPFWWVVRTSLSTQREMLANPESIAPVGLTTVNYARVLGQVDTETAVARTEISPFSSLLANDSSRAGKLNQLRPRVCSSVTHVSRLFLASSATIFSP